MNQATWQSMGVTMSADDVLQKFIPYSERIMITGCNGLLGQKLHHLLSPSNHLIGLDLQPDTHLKGPHFEYRPQDITKADELIDLVVETKPRFIINTAALTGVDLCESQKDLCWRINVLAVENLIRAAKKTKAHLIQISTDYVFDGKKPPYQEDDLTCPLGFYGKSKLASENALRGSLDLQYTIVRTQVLYGVAPKVRPNFVDFIHSKLMGGSEIKIVDDQIGTPTLADDLAAGIGRIIQLRKEGIYHISGSEAISRYDFARKIAEQVGENPDRIKPIKTEQLVQEAPRPHNSSFCLDKIRRELAFRPRDIASGLEEYQRQLVSHRAALGGNN